MTAIDRRQEELRNERESARTIAEQGWKTPNDLPGEPLHQIAYWLRREELTNDEVVASIDAARAAGAKWWEVGAAMGRTSEAARAFYQYHHQADSDD